MGYLVFGGNQRVGQQFGLLARPFDHVERQALRGHPADTGQLGESDNQIL